MCMVDVSVSGSFVVPVDSRMWSEPTCLRMAAPISISFGIGLRAALAQRPSSAPQCCLGGAHAAPQRERTSLNMRQAGFHISPRRQCNGRKTRAQASKLDDALVLLVARTWARELMLAVRRVGTRLPVSEA